MTLKTLQSQFSNNILRIFNVFRSKMYDKNSKDKGRCEIIYLYIYISIKQPLKIITKQVKFISQ